MQKIKPTSDARKTGTDLVFSAIRQTSPTPRIDIVRITGLSPATVTSITADLIANGLIEEVPAAKTAKYQKRGRPRVDLKIRGAAHLVAGVKLTDKIVTVIILDFDGARISDFSLPTEKPIHSSLETVDLLDDALKQALASANLEISDISGVGIGIPGIVDGPSGYVYWSPAISDRKIFLQDMLIERLEVPVFLDNDANLVAIAEQRFGLGREARNFIVVSVEQGVGMGIVIDGKLHRGFHGCGAELGHTKVHLDGALCRCGQRGCLEAYVGDYALLREASTALDSLSGKSPDVQMDILLSEARQGNQLAVSIIERAGRMFAMGLANVVNIFAPELIILAGERMRYDYVYGGEMIAEMKKSIMQAGAPSPEVRVHKWGDLMWAMGAAAFAIDGVSEIALKELN
ncbi:hypothetical protein A9Q96_14995 [Rhodobacterales bacterium 52_120_T64]|nr:hypothetical protein A9Q96_14995 [Rhodobacterales bacterium 52_120_T64]